MTKDEFDKATAAVEAEPDFMTAYHWRLAAFRDLAAKHLRRSIPEKGGWEGEAVGLRLDKILTRLRILQALDEGVSWTPNDDGSRRTIADEYEKLVCSVFILGDLLGVLEPKR